MDFFVYLCREMMVLHIFNPEHDLALASGLANFTAPHAGRQLHADLDFLPALWAGDGDFVLVDNISDAQRTFARLAHRSFDGFVTKSQLACLPLTRVEPWGWDLALRSFLLRQGVPPSACASEAEIGLIRRLSHRATAVALLPRLRVGGTVGESLLAFSPDDIDGALHRWGRVVAKSPWSSSGRGIRYIDQAPDDYQRRWLSNVISRQGSVEIEPLYNKVRDFAVEFESDGQGNIQCRGLSLFHTANGAYAGNILASEEEKRELLGSYLPASLTDAVQQEICRSLPAIIGSYRGPFGIDMMIVASSGGEGFMLHPCVEINLRRTMGHVALAIGRSGVMRIEYTDSHYKLKIY